MSISTDVLEKIRKETQPLLSGDAATMIAADSVHLTSIAKAIEVRRSAQIHFIPAQGQLRQRDRASFTFTSSVSVHFNINPEKDRGTRFEESMTVHEEVRHHLFYETARDSSDVDELNDERFHIGHELGHCYLHWPLTDERHKRCKWHWIEEAQFWAQSVEYTDSEEEEADAFASLLVSHRPRPTNRSTTLEIDDDFWECAEMLESRGLFHHK